ncbi:MAG: Stk1 family PASTA domain-containing Ser/Thr kinase [Firmicutes bacterium]|nr:Stk1 family PASTA domain-containing Ser/Thr kinase [Bacillota bacterium]
MFPIGTLIAERYELQEIIGSGGMAVVFRALDRKLHREVTVKVMREDCSNDPVQEENFQREAHAVAMLSHANIAGIYDVGSEQGLQYMVKEYVEGITLKEYISHRRHMSSDEIVKVTLKIAEGLRCAHRANIVHRDVKPQNVLVSPQGEVKVTDFGIAMFAKSDTVPDSKEAMGSVHYISPEQARGKAVDARSDLYSLGITMYEMATGDVPFDGESPVEVALKQVKEPMPSPREKVPDLWPGLETIIYGLTRKNPEDRYQSCDQLIADLRRVFKDPTHTGAAGSGTDIHLKPVTDEDIRKASQSGEYVVGGANSGMEEPKLTFWQRHGVLILTLGLCLALALLVSVIARFLRQNSDPGGNGAASEAEAQIVLLPGFQGMTIDEAKLAAADKGIHVTFTEAAYIYDANFAEGVIVFQDPKANTEFHAGDSVEVALTISRGERTVSRIADYENKPYEEVIQSLADLGITYEIRKQQVTKDEQVGVVISQAPYAGSEITSTTTVILTVGVRDMEMVSVPDLRGNTAEEAAAMLTELKLKVGKTTEASSETVEKGVILAQSPVGGSKLQANMSVDITVSSGKAEDSSEGGSNGRFLLSADLFAGQEDSSGAGISGQVTVEAEKSDGTRVSVFSQKLSAQDMASKDYWIEYPAGTVVLHVLVNGQEQFSVTLG